MEVKTLLSRYRTLIVVEGEVLCTRTCIGRKSVFTIVPRGYSCLILLLNYQYLVGFLHASRSVHRN